MTFHKGLYGYTGVIFHFYEFSNHKERKLVKMKNNPDVPLKTFMK
jgi:hypothetical protein